MTLQDFAREMEKVAAAMPEVAMETARWGQREALVRAVELSSGPYSSAQLAALGHPYARRHGAPQLEPTEINVQSGRFRAAWATEGPQQVGDVVVASVFNADEEVAGFLKRGTRLAFDRPLTERVTAEVGPKVQAHYDAALAALMGGP